MKLATWNIERGGRSQAVRAAQENVIRELAADVIVLTEPPASYKSSAGVVTSPLLRTGPNGSEAWVAIVGHSVEPIAFDVPYERTAVAAQVSVNGVTVIVYGTVLPWLAVTSHAPELVRNGENSFAAFKRVLAEQANDVIELRRLYDMPVLWMGDFNQSVSGKNFGGSNDRRDLLNKTLESLGMIAWNGEAAHAMSSLSAVDLICVPHECVVTEQGRIDPVQGKLTMSDHAGYWIELTASQ